MRADSGYRWDILRQIEEDLERVKQLSKERRARLSQEEPSQPGDEPEPPDASRRTDRHS